MYATDSARSDRNIETIRYIIVWEELITQSRYNTYQSHWRYSSETDFSTSIIVIILGIYNQASFTLENNEAVFTTFDSPQLKPLTSMSSVQRSSQSLASYRRD